ncbi:MAG TPA: tRNA (guanosine(46)-N7)-methyltransferase TrmB [Thiothrix sp.]|nr:tRNA (guanosine(46)-N7)-methyltransferase TrmB [Thiothrix sp.]
MNSDSTNSSSNDKHYTRKIRSFVLRQGRVTKAQKIALETLWPIFGIERANTLLNFPQLFGNDAPITLEIGFGNGASLAEMAINAPKRNFVGIEVHPPGVGNLLRLIGDNQLKNIRILNDDAVEIIQQRIAPKSLDRVQLYFPDPWHKKKHNKRRIVTAEFVNLLASRLQDNGVLHMATDWEHYALQMERVMLAAPTFKSSFESAFAPRPNYRPLTKFEQRGLKLGHSVWDLVFQKI